MHLESRACAVDEVLVWLKRSLAVAALEVGALEPRADQEDPLEQGLEFRVWGLGFRV